MTQEAAEARRQYLKQWRKDHPEACRKYRETYWQKKADAEATRRQAEKDKQTSTQ